MKSLKVDTKLSECPCLNWKQVYERGMATCGAAFEVPVEAGILTASNECPSFFEKLDDAVCVNTQKGADLGQWCYVSTTCMYPSANESAGETQVNSEVSWKGCNPDPNVKPFGDVLLRDKTMDELMEFHKEHKVTMGALVPWSFPGFGQKWEAIRPYFVEKHKVDYKQRQLMDMAIGTQAHYMFNSLNGKPPFAAIEGNKLWIIDDDDHIRVERENLNGLEEEEVAISIFTPFTP